MDEGAIRRSLEATRANCQAKLDRYQTVQEKVTPAVIAFRRGRGVALVVSTLGEYKRLLLCLLLLICATTTTFQRHHIALRPARTDRDHLVSLSGQLAANTLLLISAIAYRVQDASSVAAGVTIDNFYLHNIWIAGFGTLTLASLYRLLRRPARSGAGRFLGQGLSDHPAVQLYVPVRLGAVLFAGVFPRHQRLSEHDDGAVQRVPEPGAVYLDRHDAEADPP